MQIFRKVCPKRAKKLRNRGESVRWIASENSYVWFMQFKCLHRFQGDRTKVNTC